MMRKRHNPNRLLLQSAWHWPLLKKQKKPIILANKIFFINLLIFNLVYSISFSTSAPFCPCAWTILFGQSAAKLEKNKSFAK